MTSAQLRSTPCVAVDGSGYLFIADSGNQRIRKVSPAGTITTVAGNGTRGFSGDGGPATSVQLSYPHGGAVDGAGDLFFPGTRNHRIWEGSPGGGVTTVGGGERLFGGSGGGARASRSPKK